MTKPSRDEGLAAMIAKRITGGTQPFEIRHAYWCVECKVWWFTDERLGDNVQVWTCRDCDVANTGQVRGPEYIQELP